MPPIDDEARNLLKAVLLDETMTPRDRRRFITLLAELAADGSVYAGIALATLRSRRPELFA